VQLVLNEVGEGWQDERLSRVALMLAPPMYITPNSTQLLQQNQ